MTYFVLSLASFTIVFFVYLARTKRWKHLGYFLLFVVVFTGVLIYALKVRPYTIRGPESIYQEVLLFLSTVAGLVTNPIYHRIKGSRVNERLRDLVKVKDLVKASFVAPFIFFVVWGAIEKMAEVNVMTCCLAYTNSFFWETILKTIKKWVPQMSSKELRFNLEQFDSEIRKRCLLPMIKADTVDDPTAWDSAIRDTGPILEERLHDISGIPDSKIYGKNLVNKAFFSNESLLNSKFKAKYEREGYRDLYEGTIALFRNLYAHRIIDPTPEKASRTIAFVDLLLKMLEDLRLKKEDTP